MNDKFLSFFLMVSYNMISVLAGLTRTFLPGKPILNEVLCSGEYYRVLKSDKDNPPATFNYIVGPCLLLHIILSLPVKMTKRQVNKKIPIRSRNNVDFGGLKTSWVIMFLSCSAFILVVILSKSDPKLLKKWPKNLLVWATHSFAPTYCFTGVAISFIWREKALRVFAKQKLLDMFVSK